MKRILNIGALCALSLLLLACSSGTSWYFDAENGNDTNSGHSPKAPLRSLSKIAELEFGPGDKILLKSGSTFTEKLFFSGKGSEDKPVIIGKYGGEAYPHIKGDASELEMLHIYNSENVIVRDIEVSNKGKRIRPHLSGVLVEAYNYGRAANITLERLYVHDVYGSLIKGEGMEHEDAGGGQAMFITCRRDDGTDTVPSWFDGLLVQDCHIKDCQRNGIIMWGNWARNMWCPSLNVVIRGNLLEGVPGDGIVPTACDGALVEYNVMRDCPPTLPYTEACDGIWPFSSDNTLVQYNVVDGHKSKTDGYGYDSDYNSRNSTFRYNLCSNCEGGFLLLCNSGGWPEDWSAGNTGTRVMYNVSINDGIRDFIVTENKSDYFSPVIHITGPTYDSVIENNIFWQPARKQEKMDRRIVCSDDWRGYSDSTAFNRNYIYVEQEALCYDPTLSTRNSFEGNVYWGPLIAGEGFSNGGSYSRDAWYDPSDENWVNLVKFLEDKTVVLDGDSVPVLELLGFGERERKSTVRVDCSSTVSRLPEHPVGVNVNFFMDGGRYPDAEHSLDEALAELGVKYLRYPGGEKSDLYMFAEPPYTEASPAVCRTILAPEDYPGMVDAEGNFTYDPLNFDEFIATCRTIGAEPVIVVAADRYLIPAQAGRRPASREQLLEHAAAWVKYSNITKGYGVKYWMIGNESWNKNNVNSSAEIYANDVIAFSRAMKEVDPSILVIANGEKDEFFKTVIETAGDYIDRLCVSNYGVYDFLEGYDTYRKEEKCLVWPEQTAAGAMRKYATPSQLERLKLIVAEYGTIDWFNNWPGTNDMGHAIVNFDMTGQLLQEPLLEFACFWNTRWISNETECADHDALDRNGNITPVGMSLKMWNDCDFSEIVECRADAPLAAFAGISSDGKRISLAVANKSSHEVNFIPEAIGGRKFGRMLKAEEYYGTSPEDTRPVFRSDRGKGPLKPYSINIFEYELR